MFLQEQQQQFSLANFQGQILSWQHHSIETYKVQGKDSAGRHLPKYEVMLQLCFRGLQNYPGPPEAMKRRQRTKSLMQKQSSSITNLCGGGALSSGIEMAYLLSRFVLACTTIFVILCCTCFNEVLQEMKSKQRSRGLALHVSHVPCFLGLLMCSPDMYQVFMTKRSERFCDLDCYVPLKTCANGA